MIQFNKGFLEVDCSPFSTHVKLALENSNIRNRKGEIGEPDVSACGPTSRYVVVVSAADYALLILFVLVLLITRRGTVRLCHI